MLSELDGERLQLSDALMGRFIESEFAKTDADASGALDLNEFTGYVTQMTAWMREELMATANRKNVFATLAARSIETSVPLTPLHELPTELPTELLSSSDGDHGGGGGGDGPATVRVLRAPKFGLSVSVPRGAFGIDAGSGEGARLGLASLAPPRVAHLFDADERRRGEFAFTPVVRLDYEQTGEAAGSTRLVEAAPQTVEDDTVPRAHVRTVALPDAWGSQEAAAYGQAPLFLVPPLTSVPLGIINQVDIGQADAGDETRAFATPLTLSMPHCFSPEDGSESVVLLGAPAGSTRWRTLDALCTKDFTAPFSLGETHIRVQAPWPGLFCAFSSPQVFGRRTSAPASTPPPHRHRHHLLALSSPQVEDIARVRLHVFSLPTVPADRPTTIRVHLCPELPDQIEEMLLSEESEWGASVTAGTSELIELYQGERASGCRRPCVAHSTSTASLPSCHAQARSSSSPCRATPRRSRGTALASAVHSRTCRRSPKVRVSHRPTRADCRPRRCWSPYLRGRAGVPRW